jgi:hypothetical protein
MCRGPVGLGAYRTRTSLGSAFNVTFPNLEKFFRILNVSILIVSRFIRNFMRSQKVWDFIKGLLEGSIFFWFDKNEMTECEILFKAVLKAFSFADHLAIFIALSRYFLGKDYFYFFNHHIPKNPF